MAYDEKSLDVCKDETPESVKKTRSVVLSIIGIVLLVIDIVCMPIIDARHEIHSSEDMVYFVHSMFMEGGVIVSTVLMILAFIFHKRNVPVYILAGIWWINVLYIFIGAGIGA